MGLMLAAQGAGAQQQPWQNPDLPAEERALDLLSRMTLEEKIAQMTNGAGANERLGVPAYNWWNEALHGVGRAGLATVFPQAIGMAATFDDQAVRESFDIVSDEARAKHNDFVNRGDRSIYKGLTFWTPNINIFRDPRWGRGQETYGEDPYLTTRVGLAAVRGLQGDGTAKYDKAHACAKHYAVHSGPEWNRHTFDALDISPRDLHETYLPAFKALVQDGGVQEVMCAYNRFDGEPCCSSKELLVRILRNDWGFDGVIVSDCGAIDDFYNKQPKGHGTHPSAVEASADAVLSGTDLNCGGTYKNLTEAVERGLLSEADIDRSVLRLLTARFRLGLLDDPALVEWNNIPYSVVSSQPHKDKSLEMARKSLVLLSNRNHTLPLRRDVRKIALVGPNAADSIMMLGNYNGTPDHIVTILEGLQAKYPDAEIVYEKGCDYVDDQLIVSLFGQCSADGRKGVEAEFWNNMRQEGDPVASVHYSDPLHISTMGGTPYAPGINISRISARLRTDFTPEESGDVTFRVAADDGFRLFVGDSLVINAMRSGSQYARTYTMHVEKGHTYPVRIDYFNVFDNGELAFDFGYSVPLDFAAVVDKVADADVIIFAGGISPIIEGEEMPVDLPGFRGGDRTDIELPAVQKRLLRELKATGRPVVMLLSSGGAVALEEESRLADAILATWYPGQNGGRAIADVLSGDYNPAGRLPVTFYASSSDLPDFENYNMLGRTYRYFPGEALYPFGHGLSYTTFSYGKASGMPAVLRAGESGRLDIPVKNTGSMDGDEVVQVYLRRLDDPSAPLKSLRAFRRVGVKAGEKASVQFEITPSQFETFDTATGSMAVVPGSYELLYGPSSDSSALRAIPFRIEK